MGSASSRVGRVVVGIVVVGSLVGCSAIGGEHELSDKDRSALEAFYDVPLFAESPPGAGELLGEDFQTVCGEEGADPIGGRTWVLLDDGGAAIAYYKELGVAQGWEVAEESEPDRDAESEGRRANLVLTKSEAGYSYLFGVSIGRSILHDEVEVGAHGSIVEPSLCR